MQNTAAFTVRAVEANRISDRDLGAWAELERRALEPNAYLSPHFVRAYARHLAGDRMPQVLLVERHVVHARELAGVAVVIGAGPTLAFPVRRLVGYHTHYSPVGGVLLDRECALEAFTVLLRHVRDMPGHFGALELSLVWSDGPLPALAQSAASELGLVPRLSGATPRAVLVPANAAVSLRSKDLAQRLRDIARRQRRLQERGVVGWRLLGPEGLPEGAVEALLALEHMGWKGSGGSSLRSVPAQEAFFREMVAGFAAERRVLFSEITLDGVPIASTCNFVSGRMVFAFKIGWNPELRAYSPGWLNEVEFMRQAGPALAGIDLVDSGATEDSYINELWPERRTIATLTIPLTFAGRLAMGGLASVRVLRRRASGAAAWMFAAVARRRPTLASAR